MYLNLKNNISLIENNKIKVINYWFSEEKLEQIFNIKKLNKELFINRYAFEILDYYIDLVKNLNKNSSIKDSLIYLKKNDVNIDELYNIFILLKKSLLKYLSENISISIEIYDEVNELFDLSLETIFIQYSKNIETVKKALTKSIDIVDKNIIMSRTDLKGKIIKVSTAFCNISGYKPEELIGENHNIIRHPDMPKKLFSQMWETIKEGEIWHGEIKNQKKNGDSYWVETTIHPNFDNIGKIISYDAIRIDITSKKELEHQQNILVAQSKSAAMGEMISMIAHQWRQPLQAVSILIQKLPITKMMEGEISDELLDKVVDDINMQLDYMSCTIDDFKDYFKPNKNKQTVLIEDVINKAVEFLAYMFKVDSIQVNVNTDYSCKAELYLNEIVQVLINIIKNARDAMIDHHIENRVINIDTFFDEKNVYITIEDNAGGISENILSKIFEPYFSTKMNKNGTGLGLYMSKTIVEKHSDGKLSVCNSDIGAKFTISLPLE